MEHQEYIMQLQMLEQQAEQFGEQLKMIEQQVKELGILKESISKLETSNESEMFSEVGKGIYVKGKLDKKEMLVDVGNKILVPKSVKEIQKIIDEQIGKFKDIREEISKNIDIINQQLDKVMQEAQSPDNNKKKK